MKYYLAPLEGLTTYIFRSAYHECFTPMDKYFTPFLVPHEKAAFNFKEKNEIAPEHHLGQYLVPQIMTNRAEDFVRTALALREYGYEEVNLNLGCPSGTVVSKRRGSGFLADPEELDRFFDGVFNQLDMKISVKTRIGIEQPEEFEAIRKVYDRYPLEELIIHPRVRKDFYKNHPNLEVFGEACEKSPHTLCYNGDLFTVEDIEKIKQQFPKVDRIMLGRGIFRNPGLIDRMEHQKRMDKAVLRKFHDQIFNRYREIMSGDRNPLCRMKEFWTYLLCSFENSDKLWKKMKKAQNLLQYEAVVDQIFQEDLKN